MVLAGEASSSPSNHVYFTYFDVSVVVLAIVANCLVLMAIVNWPRLSLPGYRRFLLSLTCGDLYICIVNLLTIAYQVFSVASADLSDSSPQSFDSSSAMTTQPGFSSNPAFFGSTPVQTGYFFLKCSANILRALKLAGLFANLLNLVGMSIDIFICAVFPMKYRYIMNKRVARLSVIAIWIVSLFLAFMDIALQLLFNYYAPAAARSSMKGGGLAQSHFASYYQQDARSLNNYENKNATFFNRGEIDFSSNLEPGLSRPFEDEQLLPVAVYSSPSSSSGNRNNLSQTERSASARSDILIQQILNSSYESDNDFEILAKINSIGNQSEEKQVLLSRMLSILEDDAVKSHGGICSSDDNNKIMWFELLIIVFVLFCFIFLTICYGVIYGNISQQNILVGSATTRRTKKFILTTTMFLGAFTFCWVPFVTFEFVLYVTIGDNNPGGPGSKALMGDEPVGYTTADYIEPSLQHFFIIGEFFNSLMMMYPLVDPIIYAIRVPSVQRNILQRILCIFPCCTCLLRLLNEHDKSHRSMTNSQSTMLAQNKIMKRASSLPLLAPDLMLTESARNSSTSQNKPKDGQIIIAMNEPPSSATTPANCNGTPMSPNNFRTRRRSRSITGDLYTLSGSLSLSNGRSSISAAAHHIIIEDDQFV